MLSRFRQGEVLRASQLNEIVDAIEEIRGKLQRQDVRVGGNGLRISKGSSGTVISLDAPRAPGSGGARFSNPEHPFKVTARVVKNDEGNKVLKVRVAAGTAFADPWIATDPYGNPYLTNVTNFDAREIELSPSEDVRVTLRVLTKLETRTTVTDEETGAYYGGTTVRFSVYGLSVGDDDVMKKLEAFVEEKNAALAEDAGIEYAARSFAIATVHVEGEKVEVAQHQRTNFVLMHNHDSFNWNL